MSFFNFVKVITYLPLRIVFPVRIFNKERYFKEKAVVCCNHYKSEDVLVLASRLLWGSCNCVAKEELFESKLSAKFLSMCGAVSIKRGESDMSAYKAIMKVLKQDKQLIIFPEGTRNKEGTPEMAYFQEGAASFAIKGKAPIIPILYHKPLKPFRRNYMYIGESIDLSSYAELPSHEGREKATAFLYSEMSRMKRGFDEFVLSKAWKKKNRKK